MYKREAWCKERLSHWDVLTRIIEKGDPVSPIFAIPFLDTKCFKIDWLHVADQGISANFLGSLLSVLIGKMPGASKDDRLASLFADIQKFYKTTGCQSRLENLTHTMIRKNGSSTPKLRGRGADIRALVPYGLDAARRFLDSSDPLESSGAYGSSFERVLQVAVKRGVSTLRSRRKLSEIM